MRLLEIKTEESCMIVNNNRTNSSNLRQWHPAFFADIQIELEAERENLIFENEHQLGTKPMEIDALVIKKKSDIPINKNIGRIFRKYNIIEYKSPTDYCIKNVVQQPFLFCILFKSNVENKSIKTKPQINGTTIFSSLFKYLYIIRLNTQ